MYKPFDHNYVRLKCPGQNCPRELFYAVDDKGKLIKEQSVYCARCGSTSIPQQKEDDEV